jgi:hypothetical protein
MRNAPDVVRIAWFSATCIVGALLLAQLPTGPASDTLVSVAMWLMLSPLMKVTEGEDKFLHLGRYLVAGIAVWILSNIKYRSFGSEANGRVMFFTVGVLLFAFVGWLLESRRDRLRSRN